MDAREASEFCERWLPAWAGNQPERLLSGRHALAPGMITGFAAGDGNAHHLINHSDSPVVYLEIGDRSSGDAVTYPDDDLRAIGSEGGWRFLRKE
jgi:uncharacterized cupin superfamily protein